MNKYLNKILIVDGSYALHRSMHTPALAELTTKSGIKSGGVFGFLRTLIPMLKRHRGYYPVVCWDHGLSPRRLELYSNYKHYDDHNEAPPIPGSPDDEYIKEYHRQRADLIEILSVLGIPSLFIRGWEGDDLMYILTLISNSSVIISDDKDMIQLLSETTGVDRIMNDQNLNYETADEYYKYPRHIIRKAIVGDSSDNIPKVAAGVGDKGADQIATEVLSLIDDDYSIDTIVNAIERISESNTKAKKVVNNIDQFRINYQLTDLRLVEVPDDIEYIVKSSIIPVVGKIDYFKLMTMLSKYEISNIDVSQLISMLAPYSPTVVL